MTVIKRYGATTTPRDRDGISVAQNVTASTAMTMTGALTSGGTFTGVNGRAVRVGLYSGADMTAGGGAVVVSGFADFARNQAVTDTILYPNATYVLGTTYFAVITGIVPNTTIAQNLEIGTDADGTSATSSRIYVPLNHRARGYRVQVAVTGTITANCGVSCDPVLDGTVSFANASFVDLTGLDAIASTEQAVSEHGATLLHLTYSAATATEGAILSVIEDSRA